MNKNYFTTLLFSLLFVLTNELQAQQKTVFDQLLFVNANWQNQTDVDPLVKSSPASELTEKKLIQSHLIQTELLLRKRDMSHLSGTLQQNRLKNLNILHQYILKGRFPKNTGHLTRQPYFIDNENTYCAVGYLMKMSGADEMAKQISRFQNFSYLKDIQHAFLMQWISNSGLTFDELALIQPGYGGEWPSVIVEMHYANAGEDINEYIELHQSSGGLMGMKLFTDLFFYDHTGLLYKTLNISQLQPTTTLGFLKYQFPVNEIFADSGKIILKSINDTISVYTYNSSGIHLHDRYTNTSRNFLNVESDNTQPGNSLTFCGLYETTWNTYILPSTIGYVNPCTIGTVPVKLTSFEYIHENNSIKLYWQTETEFNSDYFEVERSNNGNTFFPIKKIKASGTSNTVKAYTFTDDFPMLINYYRLKQVDLDGKFSFSKTLVVKQKQENPFAIILNKVINTLNVQVNTPQTEIGNLAIYDISGRIVLKIKAKNGLQNINVSSLSQGLYIISLTLKNGQLNTLKFQKI